MRTFVHVVGRHYTWVVFESGDLGLVPRNGQCALGIRDALSSIRWQIKHWHTHVRIKVTPPKLLHVQAGVAGNAAILLLALIPPSIPHIPRPSHSGMARNGDPFSITAPLGHPSARPSMTHIMPREPIQSK